MNNTEFFEKTLIKIGVSKNDSDFGNWVYDFKALPIENLKSEKLKELLNIVQSLENTLKEILTKKERGNEKIRNI